nr:MAG TPA: hypothetical protein [Caudoviricetes sp.]
MVHNQSKYWIAIKANLSVTVYIFHSFLLQKQPVYSGEITLK